MEPRSATLRLHHVGIIVPDLEAGVRKIDAMLPGLLWSAAITDPLQQVMVRFAGSKDAGGPLYEVLAPTIATSPISAALRERRDAVHHLAYLCADLTREGHRLRNIGCLPVTEPTPARAFAEALIQFFYTPANFLIELIEHEGPVITLAGGTGGA